MNRGQRIAILVLAVLLALVPVLDVGAQEDSGNALSLRLRRNFGYSLGAQMQGRFTIQIAGPEDLVKVEFLLDGEVIGEDVEAPFSMPLNTREYSEGVHRLSAVGVLANGDRLSSESLSRQFVATSSTTIIVIAIVALVLAFRVGSYLLARRSRGGKAKGAGDGYLGGTVCPNCGRPFAIHWWSLRLGFSRYDRCPHCGKWSTVSRASPQALAAAEDFMEGDDVDDATAGAKREEEALRRRIDESRYE